MYVVLAHYRTAPADADTVREVLSRHAAASTAEPGCLTFTAHQYAEEPTRFVLYEAYVDEAAFAEHRTSASFLDNIEGIVAPLLLERRWVPLTVIEPAAPA